MLAITNMASEPVFFDNVALRGVPPLVSVATTPGEITSLELLQDSIRLTMPAAHGRTLGVAYSEDLEEDSWIELGNFFVVDGVAVFVDPDNERRRRREGYYRAFLRPLPGG